MSDYLANADQDSAMELFDWSSYEWGGVLDMDNDSSFHETELDCSHPLRTHEGQGLEDFIASPEIGFGINPSTWPTSNLQFPFIVEDTPNASSSALGMPPQETHGEHFRGEIDICNVNNVETPQFSLAETSIGEMDGVFRNTNSLITTSESSTISQETTIPCATGSTAETQKGSDDELPSVTCPYHGCRFRTRNLEKGSRDWNLRRHINSRHLKHKPCVCPARGCFKGQRRTSFSRPDKLTAHFRAMHNDDTEIACFHESCSGNYMPADVLAVHLSRAHGWNHSEDFPDEHRQLLNNFTDKRKCPFMTCKVHKEPRKLLAHVKQRHTISNTKNRRDGLLCDNFVYCKKRDTADKGDFFISDGRQDSMVIAMSCPVCKLICSDYLDFSIHMVDSHLAPGPSVDLQAWKSDVRRQVRPERWNDNSTDASLAGMARREDLSDLIPSRRQILRLYPGFGNNRVWDQVWEDIAKPIRKEEPISQDAPTVQ